MERTWAGAASSIPRDTPTFPQEKSQLNTTTRKADLTLRTSVCEHGLRLWQSDV